MRYIDAYKLIAEIESRMEDCKLPDGTFPTKTNIVSYEELSCLRNFITSLQQEHPEGLHFTPLNRLIQKIPSENWNDTVNNYAKKLRDCLIKEGYLKDAEVLQGYISYMNGNNIPMATMDEQDQLEVDLEEEVKRWKNKHGVVGMDDLWLKFALHFYSLGLNARKEGEK